MTGALDESTRVNILVQQQQERAGAQLTMLERLTVEERVMLRALVAKAQGGDEAIEVTAAHGPSANGSPEVSPSCERRAIGSQNAGATLPTLTRWNRKCRNSNLTSR